jgi:PadR family transcriptional regulator, regulatory protein PadR
VRTLWRIRVSYPYVEFDLLPHPMPRTTLPTTIVLYCVAHGYSHGFDIIEVSGLQSGTVYPLLRRLEDAGLLKSKWERAERARAEQRPPRRIYQVTGSGAEALEEALARFPGVARMFGSPSTPNPSPA